MKEVFKTLFIVTMVGFLAYCTTLLFETNKGDFKKPFENTSTEAYEREAEQFTRGFNKKMGNVMKNSQRVLRRAKNIPKNIDDPFDGEEPVYVEEDYDDFENEDELLDRYEYEEDLDKIDLHKNNIKTTPTTKPILLPNQVYFHIQLGRYDEQSSAIPSFDALKDLGDINSELMGKSTRISIGNFRDRNDAMELLQTIKNKGYKDAFIITSTQPIREDISDNQQVGYMIQLIVLKEPKINTFKELLNLGVLHQQYLPEKDVNKMLLGIYESEQEATETLQKVKKKGFKKAFVKVVKEDEFEEMFKAFS